MNDNNIQILQITLRINKVIKYFNSLQKSKTKQKQKQNRKLNGTHSLKCIQKSIDWKQAYIFPLVQHQTQF